MRALSLASYGFCAGATILLAVVAWRGPGVSAAEQHQVLMQGISFAPASLRAHVGDTVRWENRDIVAHTASARDKSFDVKVPARGSGASTLKRAGTFAYICRYHPNMTGEIVVEP
jgi:plastocyanin